MAEKRKWHWVDWALFGVFTLWYLTGLIAALTEPKYAGLWPFLDVLISMTVCYIVPLLFWRPGYVNLYLFPLSVLITAGVLELWLFFQYQVHVPIISLPLMIVGFLSHPRTIWWTVPVFLIGVPFFQFLMNRDAFTLGGMIDQFLSGMLVFGIGLGVQRILNSNLIMKKHLDENLGLYQLIKEQNRALEQYANHVEKLTLVEERNRVARELHDTVGHTFTSVVMGMDAVSYLLEAAPDKARERLDVLRGVTRNGLEEVRRSIHQIAPKDEDEALSQQLAQLAGEFSVHTGTQVRTQVIGLEYELPKQVQLTLIRCVQEALTNAKRHGLATSVEVVISYQTKQVHLLVEDNGCGADAMEPGFGLNAMKERIAMLQGSLQFQSVTGTGTTVSCTIPVHTQ